jgi:RNA polymerase sigma-70 factor, ECF subfamily
MRQNAVTGLAVNGPLAEVHLGDADLVERARGGDTNAFGELVRKYQDRVYNTCWRMCSDRTEAEDLAQEAFVKAFQALGGFSGRSQFYTWVFRIAVNLVLSARRRRKRAATYSLDAARNHDPGEDGKLLAMHLAALNPLPGEQVARNEQEVAVLQALGRLDEEHRVVVVLRDLEDLGYDEIAEILGVPSGTVKSRLHRARLALREELAPLFRGLKG